MSFNQMALEGVDRLSVYEPGRPIEEVARELGFDDPKEVIKLASNENSLGPSPRAREAMRAMAASMHRYPDGGAYFLKRAIAAKLKVESAQILPGNGSNELLEFIGRIFLDPSCALMASQYSFVVYRMVAETCGCEFVEIPAVELGHDLDAMLENINERTKIVIVSNPNNPTSTYLDQRRIDEFMRNVPDDVIVCFDEAYMEFVEPGKQVDTLKFVKEGRNVIVLRTFSKVYGLAGLRIGYAVAPAECIALMNRIRQPFNVNAMAMAAAVAALEDDEHVRQTRLMVRDGIEFLTARFRQMGLGYVEPWANFVLVKVGDGRRVFSLMQKRGIIVRPMDVYDLPDYIRITVGMREENERAVEVLGEVLGELAGD